MVLYLSSPLASSPDACVPSVKSLLSYFILNFLFLHLILKIGCVCFVKKYCICISFLDPASFSGKKSDWADLTQEAEQRGTLAGLRLPLVINIFINYYLFEQLPRGLSQCGPSPNGYITPIFVPRRP